MLFEFLEQMTDSVNHARLYRIAESQAGYFTARQAVAAGMARSTLSHHARRGGRFERVGWGVYRLGQFPSSPYEHVVANWLSLQDPDAVVSHESGLELYDLSDVIPGEVHFTVPRTERWRRRRPGVRLHFASSPVPESERRTVLGLPVTSVERTILDYAQDRGQPEQVALAIAQALSRGLTTRRRLRAAADKRPTRIRTLLERAIEEAG